MIDYKLLGEAKEFYNTGGYQYIEVPWRVSPHITGLTHPDQKFLMGQGNNPKVLVGSGEQGFLSLCSKGYLPDGMYQTITPCFRDELQDFTHQKQFMKLELFDNTNSPVLERIQYMRSLVEEFVRTQIADVISNPITEHLNWIETPSRQTGVDIYDDERHDLYMNHVEIGSFGVRQVMGMVWVYGTGLAEPRFSRVLNSL